MTEHAIDSLLAALRASNARADALQALIAAHNAALWTECAEHPQGQHCADEAIDGQCGWCPRRHIIDIPEAK